MIHQLVDKESLKLIRKIIYLQFSLNPELHFLAQITLEALKGSQQKNKLNVAARREYCIGWVNILRQDMIKNQCIRLKVG